MQEWEVKYRRFQDWCQTPMGHGLLTAEQAFLKQYIFDLFGYQFLLIADSQYTELTSITKMQHCLRIDPMNMESMFTKMPVDAIIVPHMFSFVKDIDTWIQACWSYLKPNGKLIITGYHYWSELGLQRLLFSPLVRELPHYSRHVLSLKKALRKNEFSISLDQKFAPRLWGKNGIVSYQPSIFGNLFCIVATKTLIPINMEEPIWKKSSAISSVSAIHACVEGGQNDR